MQLNYLSNNVRYLVFFSYHVVPHELYQLLVLSLQHCQVHVVVPGHDQGLATCPAVGHQGAAVQPAGGIGRRGRAKEGRGQVQEDGPLPRAQAQGLSLVLEGPGVGTLV